MELTDGLLTTTQLKQMDIILKVMERRILKIKKRDKITIESVSKGRVIHN